MSNFIVPVADDPIYKAALGCYVLLIPAIFHNESNESTAYSKFFVADKAIFPIPSRLGMVVLYTPAFLVSCNMGGILSDKLNLAGDLTAIVFGKRLLEAAFLHNYSGSMDLVKMIIPGSAFYTLNSLAILIWSDPAPFMSPSSILGIVMTVVGLLGNFYHHYLQTTWARGREKKYVVPHGGWFEYVACPHYFFEIISWLGIAVYGRAPLGYLAVLAFAAYLSARAQKTTDFYIAKMGEEYPTDRKNLIPFIY